jgi:SSS family solute:Na+ symporter
MLLATAAMLNGADYFILTAYFTVNLGIGVYFYSFIRGMKDYFSGGQQIPWWLSGISFYMSCFSVYAFVIYSALGYQYGWLPITLFWAYIPATLLGAFVFAPRWRRARIDSPVEYLETRFNGALRQLTAWQGAPVKLIDDSLKLVATGIFISRILDLPLEWSILAAGLIMLAYTFLGGLWAVTVTDFVQFVVMIAAVVVLVPLSLDKVGGVAAFVQASPQGFFHPVCDKYGWIYVGSMTFMFCLSFSSVHWQLIQRYTCVRDEKETHRVGLCVTFLHLVTPIAMFLPAMAARQYLPADTIPEQVYPVLCTTLLPNGLLGLVIAAMLAATMSMLSGDCNVCASVLTNDVYRRHVRPRASQRELVVVGRLVTLLIGLTSIGIALFLVWRHEGGHPAGGGQGDDSLFRAMVQLFSIATAPVAVPMIAGLLSRRITPKGALAGYLTGLFTGLTLYFMLPASIVVHGEVLQKENVILLVTVAVTLAWTVLVSRPGRLRPEERRRIDAFLNKLATPIGQLDEDRPADLGRGHPAGGGEGRRISPFGISGAMVVLVGLMMLGITPWLAPGYAFKLDLGLAVALLAIGLLMIVYARWPSSLVDKVRGIGPASARLCVVMAAGACLACAGPVQADSGYDWQEWKKITTWTRTDISNDQAGKRKLAPLLETGGNAPGKIDDISPWEAKRSAIATAVRGILGRPTDLRPAKPEVQTIGEETLADHVRRSVRVLCEPDEWITATILLPRDAPASGNPAMICVGRTAVYGDREPCGAIEDANLAFAMQLVRRGYVCVVPVTLGGGKPDPAGAEPRRSFMAFCARHPGWSLMGKAVWDIARITDYLASLPSLDPQGIGIIGHGYAGAAAMLAGTFDPRLSVVICDGGFIPFRGDPTPDRWWHQMPLIPQLGAYLPRVEDIPFDWHEVAASIAPRPLYILGKAGDGGTPSGAVGEAVLKDLQGVYGLYGASDDVALRAMPDKPPATTQPAPLVCAWLEERLFRIGDIRTIPKRRDEWEKQRPLIRRLVRRTLGTLTAQPPPFDVKVIAAEQLPTYERRLIEYSVDQADRVRAYLCIPRVERRPLPAVLVLNGTHREGKDVPMGLAKRWEAKEFAFGADLAERGYLTLVPDCVTMGERIDRYGYCNTRGVYLRHPNVSVMTKMLYDDQRAVDLLLGMKEVDPSRIGVIGLSLGGQRALLLAAFDERVKATVCSVGTTSIPAESPKVRLNLARDHNDFSYFPRLRPVLQRGLVPPWDFDLLIRLVAPRAFFHHTRDQDEYFPRSVAAYEACEASRPVWRLYGQPDDALVNVHEPGTHGMSRAAKIRAYEWLDRQLELGNRP